jgi:cellulose synthase/poly-beta-1,6-N-acetylglucosamine synthase-like glycosyltransferase
MRELAIGIVWYTDLFIISFLLLYNFLHVLFLWASFEDTRYWISRPLWEARERLQQSAFLPSITLLVPAYNEEVTIVESLRSLLRLEYPQFEIVIVNDGSKDDTVGVLERAFGFVRSEIDFHPSLPSAYVRGRYEAPVPEFSMARRLVLIDKENGGKADALNAAINAAKGDFVCSMDADSLLVPDALMQLIIPILEDVNSTVAVGGQVVPSNGCEVRNGKLLRTGVPKTWIARFQLVEYIRSFTQGRTALSRYNSVLILSGVCAIFQRDLLMRIGGFLTPRMTNRVGIEYCGEESETVCEDMEVVLRMHRYLIDTGVKGRVIFFPMPIAWTEVPEVYVSLGKQRGRWYRGLWECITYHRAVLFNPRYKQLGLFALPYQFLFEAMAPLLEGIGYMIVPITWAVGILDTYFLFLFLIVAIGFNILISSLSVAVGLWSEGRAQKGYYAASLLPFTVKDVAWLVWYGILSNFGYRQYIVYYQLKGFKDFLAGKKSWDKFARKGFQNTNAG